MVIPEQGAHVWEWFWELSRRRRSGPEALSYAEVDAWQRMTGTLVLPVEVELLMRMDDAFLAAVGEEQMDTAERRREQAKGNR